MSNIDNIIIRSPRLLVRRFTSADGNDFAEILTDSETVFYEPYEVFTQEQAIAEAEKFSHDERFFAVEHQETGKMIGKLYFSNQSFSNTYEIGYTFNRQYWNQGYASEAVRAFLQYAFTETQVTRICAIANVKNKRSCHLLEKLEFQKEGVFLENVCQLHFSERIIFCYYSMVKNCLSVSSC
ncbi:MAG: GNAT family N-acetyltransferase [Oscillospiraceae bacterium]|nr:GNAT family N-acetyltransferase [Oscillospiraceae bacterium]